MLCNQILRRISIRRRSLIALPTPKCFSSSVFDRLSKEFSTNSNSGPEDESDDEIDISNPTRDNFKSHRRSAKRESQKPEIIDLDAQLRDYEMISVSAGNVYDEESRPIKEFEKEKFPPRNILKFDTTKSTTVDGSITFKVDAEQLAHIQAENNKVGVKRFDIDLSKSMEALDREVIESFKLFGITADDATVRKWAGLEVTRDQMEDIKATPSIVTGLKDSESDQLSEVEAQKIRLRSEDGVKTSSALHDYTHTKTHSFDDKGDDLNMTPSQIFFRENKDKLLERARQHFASRHVQKQEKSNLAQEYEIDDLDPSLGGDSPSSPVVRPPKDYLWDFGDTAEQIERESVVLEAGRLPTIEELMKILEQEHIADVVIIDLQEAGRRDLGRFALIGSCQNSKHAQRVGRLLAHSVMKLDVPFVQSYCTVGSWYGGDDHVLAHLGPIKVHLMTLEGRQRYNLEDAWLHPHEHYNQPGDFPAYWDYDPSLPPAYLMRNNSQAVYPIPNDNVYSDFNEEDDYDTSQHQ